MDVLTETTQPETPVSPIKLPRFTGDTQFTFDPITQWQALGQTLFAAQQQVLNSTAKIALYQGGYACGKTHAAVLFGLRQAFKQPGSQGIVLAQHSATLLDSMMPEYNRLLQMLGLVNGQHFIIRKTARCIVLKNGSVIQFRTVRQQWQTLNADWAQVERLSDIKKPDAFNALLARLNKSNFKLLATTLPAANHWLNQVFNTDNSLFTTIIGQTADNTTLDPSYTAMMQTVLTRTQQASLLYGQTPEATPSKAAAPPKTLEKAQSNYGEQILHTENNNIKNTIEYALWTTPTRFTAKKPKKPAGKTMFNLLTHGKSGPYPQ